ncbi:MAG: prepilin-type N-terminal cleavage/methylation domain-containing protein [Candidatus Omnitrophota bacterium]
MLKKKKAFTYIELLVALAIIAVLFVPVMQLFSYSVYSSSVSQDIITAANLARWQTERLKNLNLTKEELRRRGNEVYPPMDEEPVEMNKLKWRIKREIIAESDPLEVRIVVFPDKEEKPLITLVTLIEDMQWETVTEIP